MPLRAESAGCQLANAVVEMVNLMYQNNTAAKFYSGLVSILNTEIEHRSLDIKVVKITGRRGTPAQQRKAKMPKCKYKGSCPHVRLMYKGKKCGIWLNSCVHGGTSAVA